MEDTPDLTLLRFLVPIIRFTPKNGVVPPQSRQRVPCGRLG